MINAEMKSGEYSHEVRLLDEALRLMDWTEWENVLTDSGNAAGSVLAGLEDRNITASAPAKSSEPAADSPVRRDDLTQPVPESQWPWLKLSDRKQLDKSCFVYDETLDQYFCPMGRVLKLTAKAFADHHLRITSLRPRKPKINNLSGIRCANPFQTPQLRG